MRSLTSSRFAHRVLLGVILAVAASDATAARAADVEIQSPLSGSTVSLMPGFSKVVVYAKFGGGVRPGSAKIGIPNGQGGYDFSEDTAGVGVIHPTYGDCMKYEIDVPYADSTGVILEVVGLKMGYPPMIVDDDENNITIDAP